MNRTPSSAAMLALVALLVLGLSNDATWAARGKPWVGKTKAYIEWNCQGELAALYLGEGASRNLGNSPIAGTNRRGLGRELRSLDIPAGYCVRLYTGQNLDGRIADLEGPGCVNVPAWIQGLVGSLCTYRR